MKTAEVTSVDTNVDEVAEAPTETVTVTISPGDPMSVGITALREAGLDPLRLWSLKAPKDAGGIVSAVFLQGDSRVVLMHQFPSGKFALFGKVTLDDVVELK